MQELKVGDKCFVTGEFTEVFYIGDINDQGNAWIIHDLNGEVFGWIPLTECHRGERFGEEAGYYADLLTD